jgi:hypothetical protein
MIEPIGFDETDDEYTARLEAEIVRLTSALESLTEDPPATLDEPDPDWEVIIKMRNIAREALGLPHGPTQ